MTLFAEQGLVLGGYDRFSLLMGFWSHWTRFGYGFGVWGGRYQWVWYGGGFWAIAEPWVTSPVSRYSCVLYLATPGVSFRFQVCQVGSPGVSSGSWTLVERPFGCRDVTGR